MFSKFAVGIASFAMLAGGAYAAVSSYIKAVYAEPEEFGVTTNVGSLSVLPNLSARVYLNLTGANGDIVIDATPTNPNAATTEVKFDSAKNQYYVEISAGSIEGISTSITINTKDNNGEEGCNSATNVVNVTVEECFQAGGLSLARPSKSQVFSVYLANASKTKFFCVDDPSGKPSIKVTNDIRQATVFEFNHNTTLRCKYTTFYDGGTRDIFHGFDGNLSAYSGPLYGGYCMTREQYGSEEAFYEACPRYAAYPGVVSTGHGNDAKYLGILNNAFKSESMSALDSGNPQTEPVFLFSATGTGRNVELDQDTFSVRGGQTVTATGTVKYISSLKAYVSQAPNYDNKPTVSEVDDLNRFTVTFKVPDYPGVYRIKVQDNSSSASDSLEITASAGPKAIIEAMTTKATLAYRYEKDGEGNFLYSSIVMRFGAVISKELWNDLASQYEITGFGVLIADGSNFGSTPMDSCLDRFVNPHDYNDHIETSKILNYFVSIEDMNEKMGDDGTNYYWNLRQEIVEYGPTFRFLGCAYIKVGEGYIFLNHVRHTLVSLAQEYLDSPDYDETTAGGSLKHIVVMNGVIDYE